jgi:hypothetical protein
MARLGAWGKSTPQARCYPPLEGAAGGREHTEPLAWDLAPEAQLRLENFHMRLPCPKRGRYRPSSRHAPPQNTGTPGTSSLIRFKLWRPVKYSVVQSSPPQFKLIG